MGFQVSPGIVVSEIDLTTVIPSVATTDCAFAAPFQWGPVDQIITIDSENTLFNIFNGPADELSTSNNTGQAAQWMTAASFLSYGDRLHIVRVVGDFAFNAVSEGTAPQIKNIEEYENIDEQNLQLNEEALKKILKREYLVIFK